VKWASDGAATSLAFGKSNPSSSPSAHKFESSKLQVQVKSESRRVGCLSHSSPSPEQSNISSCFCHCLIQPNRSPGIFSNVF